MPIYIETYAFRQIFHRTVARCVEHGLIQALNSSAANFFMLHKASEPDKRPAGSHQYIEFQFHIVGLTVAAIVFISELLSVAQWPRRLIAQRNAELIHRWRIM